MLAKVFDGEPESIKVLVNTISNGRLLETGLYEQYPPEGDEITDKDELRANINPCFFGYVIPALWHVLKNYAFIIDAGHACGGIELTDYLTTNTMTSTAVCIDWQQYYLVSPDGNAVECVSVCYNSDPCQKVCSVNKFIMPPILDLSARATLAASPRRI